MESQVLDVPLPRLCYARLGLLSRPVPLKRRKRTKRLDLFLKKILQKPPNNDYPLPLPVLFENEKK